MDSMNNLQLLNNAPRDLMSFSANNPHAAFLFTKKKMSSMKTTTIIDLYRSALRCKEELVRRNLNFVIEGLNREYRLISEVFKDDIHKQHSLAKKMEPY